MLYDFHQKQNARKPSSVHAIYLLDGVPKPIVNGIEANGHRTEEEDARMQSSPFASSAAQQEDKVEELATPARSILLAREEDLQAAKGTLEKLYSIHVYSLQPNRLQNLQSLLECNRSISTVFNSEDPLVVGQQYGVIHNGRVRRRTARRPLGVAPSVAAAKAAEKVTPRTPSRVADSAKAESTAASLSSQDSKTKHEAKPETKPPNKGSHKMPALKRERSDIFKSFSKPKSATRMETTDSSVVDSSAPASQDNVGVEEDQHMTVMSDSEQEENFVPDNRADPEARNARSQRTEQLRKMMEEEEDDVEMADSKEKAVPETSQDSVPLDDPTEQQEEPLPEPAPTIVSGGRRRGRRKVMKKKTTKDEEGYLVTKEEPAWESFSEDEPDLQNERAPVSSAASSKGKRAGNAKPGQGNIMSFFGKK